MLAMQYSSNKF